MKLHKYSKLEFKLAVSQSSSLRQTLIRLNVSPFGGTYEVLKKAIRYFEIDTSHFDGQAWNKGKKLPPRKSLHEYLVCGSRISSFKLKNRLLREGILSEKCSRCKNSSWLNQPIPLELDHINGDNQG